jgi:hypothetical protein
VFQGFQNGVFVFVLKTFFCMNFFLQNRFWKKLRFSKIFKVPKFYEKFFEKLEWF